MDRLPIASWHRRAVVVVGLGLFFEIYEVFLAGVLSGVLTHRFHLGKSEVSMLLASAFFGMFLGALTFGWVTDRLGRRFGFLLSLIVYSAFSLVGAFSVGPLMLVMSRFLAGLGIGATPPIADCYLADLLPAHYRGKYTAWAYTLSFGGVPLAGFLGRWLVPRAPLGFDGWRWMFVVGALGGIVVFALRAALPESPRWLESVGRVHEAKAIVERLELHAGVDRIPESDVRAPVPDQRGVRRQLLVPPYRRRTLMMMTFHLLQTWGYYGFGTLAPMVLRAKGFTIPDTLLFSALTFLGYPIGSALSVPMMERFERKHLVVGAAIGMALLGLGFGLAGSARLIVVCGLGYTLVSNIFSNTFHVYQAEIFPTQLRATAVSSAYSLSRLSSGLMPFVLVPLLHTRGSNALFTVVAAALAIVALDIGMFGPRTTGRAVDGV